MTTYRPHELPRRREAEVVRAEPLGEHTRRMAVLGTEIMAAESRWDLVGRARKAAERGEVRVLQRDPQWNATEGYWELRVVRLKEPAPGWHRPLMITLAVGTPAVVFLALLYWLLTALAALPLALLCGAAVVGLAGVIAVTRAHFRPRVSISQRIDIR